MSGKVAKKHGSTDYSDVKKAMKRLMPEARGNKRLAVLGDAVMDLVIIMEFWKTVRKCERERGKIKGNG